MKKTISAILAALSISAAAQAQVQMPQLFSNGMVLQQKSQAPIWGKAKPGEKIDISYTWGSGNIIVSADPEGNWVANLPTPQYGGPYSIIIKASNTVYINDVMIGEVWLASGQSNMEMPMEGWPDCPVENGPEDIASSLNNNIRIFMAARAMSFSPENNIDGEWKSASPATTPKFGATCYYFARRINAELGIPVGIINTSWGGTPVESWIPQEHISQIPEYKQKSNLLNQSRANADVATNWIKSHPSISMADKAWKDINLSDSQLASPSYNDSQWKTMNLPQLWENTEMHGFDGITWFRKEITISKEMAGKDLIISLGPIDDMDQTFYNGELIGQIMETGYYATPRTYTVPANKVKEGKATIAVRVSDSQGGGGIYGNPALMKYHSKDAEQKSISLAGSWKYMPVAELFANKLYQYNPETQEAYQKPTLPIDLSEQTPTCLYNAMVSPIAGYKIAGAIWYQGCANVGRGEEYSRTFPALIKSWREKWGYSFPFYYAQIAPWNYGEQGNSAEIREAQRLALSIENTGMAVTMDIGNNDNIHPANKHEVGDRLASIALHNIYSKSTPYSGPQYKQQQIEGNKLILTFSFAEGLHAKSSKIEGFEICGKDGKYYAADPEIDGDKIILSSPKVKKPVSARYLWTNTLHTQPLYNSSNLPSGSFQTTRCWK